MSTENIEQKTARRLNAAVQAVNSALSQLQDFIESYNVVIQELQANRIELKTVKAEHEKLKAIKGVKKG